MGEREDEQKVKTEVGADMEGKPRERKVKAAPEAGVV